MAALAVLTVAGCSSSTAPRATPPPSAVSSAAAPSTTAVSTPASVVSSTHPLPSVRPRSTAAPRTSARPTPTRTPTPTPRRTSSAPSAGRLPLNLPTGTARQVITVTAPSPSSTTATLRTWTRSGTGWRAVAGPILAHLGSAGVGTTNEGESRTPAGSFTLTQAFGHDADPGTALPYTHTTPDDWWISQPGSLYNTFQRCASSCGFTRGAPNEHLYYETPYYNYAVVIDYNTRNSPTGVRQGAGSAFFLHVTDGGPTAGCVSIPQGDLTSIMRWLSPSAHPRILIGVA